MEGAWKRAMAQREGTVRERVFSGIPVCRGFIARPLHRAVCCRMRTLNATTLRHGKSGREGHAARPARRYRWIRDASDLLLPPC